jgi:Ni,Fe-hydrogenase III small subunit
MDAHQTNSMIHVYCLNTGSCGGCDREIAMAVRHDAGLQWAESPQTAEVLLLTGPITSPCKAPLLQLLREVGPRPLLVVGRCAIDGAPFGKGGVREWKAQEGDGDLAGQPRLDGCPTTPEAIAEAIRARVGQQAEAVPSDSQRETREP